METTELMIGDWVLYDGQPYQVKQLGIFGENRDGEDFPAVCIGKPIGICLIVERNVITPIPLTPEILEKNGFKWLLTDSKYITYCINKPTINASKNKESGEWLICVGPSGSTKKRFVEISCVKYVHELQNALRLCKAEKEIVL